MSHQDRVYVVTGAGSGIGRCAAIRLAKAGAKLALLDLKIPDEVLAEVKQYNKDVLPVVCNISKAEEVNAVHEQIARTLGPIDGAANLAGVMSQDAPIVDALDSDWNFIIDINLTGNKNCIRAQLRNGSPGGVSIVNTSSCSGQFGTANNACYSAAKAGVLGLTRAVALEVGKSGSRVNAVVPGVVNTPFISHWTKNSDTLARWSRTNAMGRLAEPDEIAAVVCFLLSPDSSFVNGSHFNVDGGRY